MNASKRSSLLLFHSLFMFCLVCPIYSNEINHKQLEEDRKEQIQFREEFCRNQIDALEGRNYTRICPDFNIHYLKFYFSLFGIIALGAATRTILKVFNIPIPYTVVLMVFGLLIGLGTREDNICKQWSMYTKIARTNPKIILFVFLPVLIFESAFGMKSHVFYRSIISILIMALPGMLITTFLTAGATQQIFSTYNWDFQTAALFGAIISATDPVAVVAILRELGTSEMLSISIEGESLLNDGVAILLYEIFLELKAPEEAVGSGENLTLEIFKMFMQIAIGGSVFGFLMGKTAVIFLSRIFNDPPVEISVTLCLAYLTYYVGEAFLGVSGVIAVVVAGIVMSAERTCISPEVQGLVHHFWEMLGYLGNTVLFVLVGIVITETAINSVTAADGYYLIFLYFALNIIRFLMVLLLSPVLSRVGYGLSWQNMIVMTWGGLRGAVGICLALEVFEKKELCESLEIGPKFLLHTAGIVLLTLLVNGTTTKGLLNMLKLTELSIGKIQDMNNAVKQIEAAQARAMAVMKHDRFLADCNWEILETNTTIENPYAKLHIKAKSKIENRDEGDPTLLIEGNDARLAVCPSCEKVVEAEPTNEEFREITEEARLRLLKAMKVSCWRQYEQGILTEEAVQLLVDYIENVEDRELTMFHADELKKYWNIRGAVAWIRNKLLPLTVIHMEEDEKLEEPDQKWRLPFFKLTNSKIFQGFIILVILINMIPIIWETVYIIQETDKYVLAFLIINIVFTMTYLLECAIKVIGLGLMNYISVKWNVADFVILLLSILEMILSCAFYSEFEEHSIKQQSHSSNTFLKFIRFFRLVRITRVFRLFRPLMPRFVNQLNARVNAQLFLGYDVAKGSVTALEDVSKFLPQMISQPTVLHKLKSSLEEQRLRILLEMGLLQKDYPGIAIAVKTRHAARGILNQMRDSLHELKEEGLVDEKEYEVLLHVVEQKMKKLWDSPAFMLPRRPEMLIADLQWVGGDKDVFSFLLKQAVLLHYAVGDTIFERGDTPNGIYVIVSGVVKITYKPTYEIIQARETRGEIPNIEIFYEPNLESPMEDYYTTGGVIGEIGVVTGSSRAASVTCETGVLAYHIPQPAMQRAIDTFNVAYDSLESRLWRTVGMRIGAAILPMEPAFQAWTMDRIKYHLELSAVPVGEEYLTLTIPDFVMDVVLIYGQVVDANNAADVYTAPCLLPQSVQTIKPREGNPLVPKVLLIGNEDLDQFDSHSDNPRDVTPSAIDIHQLIMVSKQRHSIGEDEINVLNRSTTMSRMHSKRIRNNSKSGTSVPSRRSIRPRNKSYSRMSVHSSRSRQ